MPLPIPADRLRSEVDQIIEVLQGVKERLDAGIPGDDVPANDINQEIFQVQLRGEVFLAGERLDALYEVLGQ